VCTGLIAGHRSTDVPMWENEREREREREDGHEEGEMVARSPMHGIPFGANGSVDGNEREYLIGDTRQSDRIDRSRQRLPSEARWDGVNARQESKESYGERRTRDRCAMRLVPPRRNATLFDPSGLSNLERSGPMLRVSFARSREREGGEEKEELSTRGKRRSRETASMRERCTRAPARSR